MRDEKAILPVDDISQQIVMLKAVVNVNFFIINSQCSSFDTSFLKNNNVKNFFDYLQQAQRAKTANNLSNFFWEKVEGIEHIREHDKKVFEVDVTFFYFHLMVFLQKKTFYEKIDIIFE